MKCADGEKRLSAYLDGLVSLEERASLEAHLTGCEACTRRLAELRHVVGLLEAPPLPPSGRVWERITATLDERATYRVRAVFRRFAPRTLAAAAGILLALGAFGLAMPGPSALAPEERYLSGVLTLVGSTRLERLEKTRRVDPPFEELVFAIIREGRNP